MHIHSCAHTYIHRDIQTRPTGTRTNTETRVNTEESEHIKDVDIQQTAFTNTQKGKHDNMTSRHKDKNLHNIRISRKHKTENMREHLLKSKQISF